MNKNSIAETNINKNEEKPFNLIDGATGQTTEFTRSVEQQQKIVSDTSNPLEIRLEAYEDVIDSEVGDTTLCEPGISKER